jgi:DNA-binding PadR family transcriptional regulator
MVVILTVQIKRETGHKIIPEDYLSLTNVPPELFNSYRMLIMQDFVRHGIAEYRQLKNSIPKITDGNLASHLKVLEKGGYIRIHKEIVDRKIRTSYEITDKGFATFKQFADAITTFFREGESCNE